MLYIVVVLLFSFQIHLEGLILYSDDTLHIPSHWNGSGNSIQARK